MRVRTEYMKKFKDPQWESYSKCYEELLRYRMSRRLLEHSHNPWFWSGSDSDSSDVCEGPTQPKETPTETGTAEDRREAEEYEHCRGEGGGRQEKLRVTLPETVPKILLPAQVEDVSPPAAAADGDQLEAVGGLRPQVEEEKEGQRATSRCGKQPRPHARHPDTGTGSHALFQGKTSKTTKPAQHVKRVRSAPKHKPREGTVEGRHPFALYGRGERSADMAAKRTHNVGPAASTVEIYESALRAKSRREVERLLQTQKAEQRRATSVDLDKNRTRPAPPEFNPWLTEYMSCFAARAR